MEQPKQEKAKHTPRRSTSNVFRKPPIIQVVTPSPTPSPQVVKELPKHDKELPKHDKDLPPVVKIETNQPIVIKKEEPKKEEPKKREHKKKVEMKKEENKTKYQEAKESIETLVKDFEIPSDTVKHEYGYSESFTVSTGKYRTATIETDDPLRKEDMIFISVVSDDGKTVLGGLSHYLQDYPDNSKTFDVIIENNSETRQCRINYHKVSRK